jgi:hypothetical protein
MMGLPLITRAPNVFEKAEALCRRCRSCFTLIVVFPLYASAMVSP